MNVHNELGMGFPEKYYHRALGIEFYSQDIKYSSEKEFLVSYKDKIIWKRIPDFIIEDKVLLEIKAIDGLDDAALVQALNYLEVAEIEIGLLINFGSPSLEFRRLINKQKFPIYNSNNLLNR